MELDTGELFSVPPEDFVATRDRLAAAAREAGDTRLAKEIRGLRRPTLTAWAVNLLAHQDAEALGTLLEVGDELRRAWERGDGLGEPERQRSRLIRRLVRRTAELAAEAGHPLRESASREIEETLNAATIDPQAAAQVRAGRLTRTLSHTGFAPPGSLPAPATPIKAARPSGGTARTGGRARGQAGGAAAVEERRLRLRRLTVEADNAAETATAAERDQADWSSELAQAQRELTAADDDVERLRAELRAREGDREKAERRARLARREHDRAVRSAATARRRAGEARQRLDQASADDGPAA